MAKKKYKPMTKREKEEMKQIRKELTIPADARIFIIFPQKSEQSGNPMTK